MSSSTDFAKSHTRFFSDSSALAFDNPFPIARAILPVFGCRRLISDNFVVNSDSVNSFLQYEVEESEYVRKAEVDEERKETRLQGLKDQLAAAEGEEAGELREEIEELESRIQELTEFKSGTQFHNPTGSES